MEVDEVAVRHVVSVVKHLVLLQVNLESVLIGKIVERLFEFDEVLHSS